jgi:hypothetical protein
MVNDIRQQRKEHVRMIKKPLVKHECTIAKLNYSPSISEPPTRRQSPANCMCLEGRAMPLPATGVATVRPTVSRTCRYRGGWLCREPHFHIGSVHSVEASAAPNPCDGMKPACNWQTTHASYQPSRVGIL